MKNEIGDVAGLLAVTAVTAVVVAVIDGTIAPVLLVGAGVVTALLAIQSINRQ